MCAEHTIIARPLFESEPSNRNSYHFYPLHCDLKGLPICAKEKKMKYVVETIILEKKKQKKNNLKKKTLHSRYLGVQKFATYIQECLLIVCLL